MACQWVIVDTDQADWVQTLEAPAQALREGRLVAFPTETVYGLGANAFDATAVEGIYRAKGRPSDNPLIVHLANVEDVWKVATAFPTIAQRLAARFWPGPLTLVLPARSQLPRVTLGGLQTVAVRLPSHPVAQQLLRLADVPVAAPSANRSGRPSPTTAAHVFADLGDRMDYLIDGGPCLVGVESTVLDVTVTPPVLLRPGGIPKEVLEATVGTIEVPAPLQPEEHPRAPGMKYRHYAPQAPLLLLEGPFPAVVRAAQEELRRAEQAGVSTGLITDRAYAAQLSATVVRILGDPGETQAAAAALFDALRAMDQAGVDRILATPWPRRGMGEAVMNRLEKAAGGHVRRVGAPDEA